MKTRKEKERKEWTFNYREQAKLMATRGEGSVWGLGSNKWVRGIQGKTCRDEHWVMHRIVKSLHCTLKPNRTLMLIDWNESKKLKKPKTTTTN